eukprot:gene10268-12595_t
MRISVTLLVTLLVTISSVSAIRPGHNSALNKGLLMRGVDLEEKIAGGPTAQYFLSQVDNFNPLNSDTFNQLYYVNSTYWQPGGPVFYLLGGEGPLTQSAVTGHFVLNTYAQKFSNYPSSVKDALIVAIEHRFYGQSVPYQSLSSSNLQYLTTPQALADYANFITFFKTKYNTGASKWIAFGGSYSGNLSAWMRLKYPQLIAASIATSAPVLPQLNFPEYFEVVATSIGQSCSDRISTVMQNVTEMLATNRQQAQNIFNACDPIVTELDIATFMESLSGGVATTVQYNNDNNKYTMFNITVMCNLIEDGGEQDAVTMYAQFNNAFNKFSGDSCTTSSYQTMITQMQDTSIGGPNSASRSWFWQTCTEYGYYQTGDSPNQPFSSSITLEYFLQQCEDIFGYPNLTPNTQWILDLYGGKDIVSSNILFPNGNVDPWHILGVLSTQVSGLQTIVIPQTAHCADLYPPLPNDPPLLVQARQMAVNLIASVL